MDNVVFIAHPSADLYGSDLQLVETVRGFTERGATVTVSVPERGPLVDILRAAGAHVVFLPAPVLRKASLSPGGIARHGASAAVHLPAMVRAIRRSRARVVLVNTVTIPAWITAAKMAHRPLVVHVHEAETHLPRPVQAALAAPLKAADVVIANSKHTRAALLSAAPFLDERRVHAVPNGVPGPDVEPTPTAPHAGPARLLLLGRLSRRKGTLIAIEAAGVLRRQDRDVHLTIAGSAWDATFGLEVRDAIEREGISEHVTLTGYAERWAAYAVADVALVPSYGESFGNVAIEALLAARPVVVADVGGLAENVRGGVDAALVPPGDAESLASATAWMLADPARASEMGVAGRKRALREFDPQIYRRAMWSLTFGLISLG